MTDTQLTILITGIPGTLAAIGALISSLRNGSKTDANRTEIIKGNETAARIEVHTNGMTKKLEDAAFIAGAKSETDKTP